MRKREIPGSRQGRHGYMRIYSDFELRTVHEKGRIKDKKRREIYLT